VRCRGGYWFGGILCTVVLLLMLLGSLFICLGFII